MNIVADETVGRTQMKIVIAIQIMFKDLCILKNIIRRIYLDSYILNRLFSAQKSHYLKLN